MKIAWCLPLILVSCGGTAPAPMPDLPPPPAVAPPPARARARALGKITHGRVTFAGLSERDFAKAAPKRFIDEQESPARPTEWNELATTDTFFRIVRQAP